MHYLLLYVLGLMSLGCVSLGATAPPATQASNFDPEVFTREIGKLPPSASWSNPYDRMAFVLQALEAAGWTPTPPMQHPPEGHGRDVVRALFEAAMQQRWMDSNAYDATVPRLASDVRLVCEVPKHAWAEELYLYLNENHKGTTYKTAMALLEGAEALTPDVELAPCERIHDIFSPELSRFRHYMYAKGPEDAAQFLYRPWHDDLPMGRTERLRLLAELKYLRRLRNLEISQAGPEHRAEAIAAPISDRYAEVLARFAREGGEPGQALAIYYYHGPLGYDVPVLEQALVEADSDFARWAFEDLRQRAATGPSGNAGATPP